MTGRRKPIYKYTEEWEKEVPELTEAQERVAHAILNDLGKDAKYKEGRIIESLYETFEIHLPTIFH